MPPDETLRIIKQDIESGIIDKIKKNIPYWDLKNDDINECLDRIDDLFPKYRSA